MPKGRSYTDVIKQELDLLSWIAEQEKKAPRRRPARTGKAPAAGTLFAKRNKLIGIREGALRLVHIIITYKKTTTGETKKYVVDPYSYRYRRLKVGRRKMLYAWDTKDRHTKSFALRNIQKVALTDRKFRPKWPVEII